MERTRQVCMWNLKLAFDRPSDFPLVDQHWDALRHSASLNSCGVENGSAWSEVWDFFKFLLSFAP